MIEPHTIILAFHGAGQDSRANAQAESLARALAARRPDTTVRATFRIGSPSVEAAIKRAQDGWIMVVPLMTSDGYFARGWLARTASASARATQQIVVTPPLGMMPQVDDTACQYVQRARTAWTGESDDVTALVVAHGTQRHESSGTVARRVATSLARRQGIGRTLLAFLDQPPFLHQVVKEMRTGSIVVLPLLMGGGTHATSDLPTALGLPTNARSSRWQRAADARPVWLCPALGSWDELTDLTDRMVRTAAKRFPLRLGTRQSPLALWQARAAVHALANVGVPTRIVPIDTAGDRDQSAALDGETSRGLFTGDLDNAMESGEIDLAVHSLKDLPIDTALDGSVAAMLKRGSSGEALVSRRGGALADLPAGAAIGTSSARRAFQLRRLRPDVRWARIRGPVDARVRQVDQGLFDAAILACAGLERLGLQDRIVQRFSLREVLPQAGQGVIAIQTRRDDPLASSVAARVDDPDTRRATTTELLFARAVESRSDQVAACHATTLRNTITLHARVMSAGGEVVRDAVATGNEPSDVARAAADELLRSNEMELVV